MVMIMKFADGGVKQKEFPHPTTGCAKCSIVHQGGKKHLQIDAYSTEERAARDNVSYTMRFTPEAMAQLLSIWEDKQ